MPVLEGRSVRLRPPERRDLEGLFAWYNDPEIVAPFDRFEVDTFDDFARSIERAPGDPVSLAPRYAVETRSPPEVVGVVGHYRPHPVLEFVDVWYVLGKTEARGKGYGREAVGLLVDHLFDSESVERVGATCDVENVPSVRLLEGLGLRREGTLRSALFHHGAWHDVHVYGITRAERKAARPRG
jgi:[ribosomal protein S5]-alanine N-acetyltransferase